MSILGGKCLIFVGRGTDARARRLNIANSSSQRSFFPNRGDICIENHGHVIWTKIVKRVLSFTEA